MFKRFLRVRVVAALYRFFQMLNGLFLVRNSLLRVLDGFLHMPISFGKCDT